MPRGLLDYVQNVVPNAGKRPAEAEGKPPIGSRLQHPAHGVTSKPLTSECGAPRLSWRMYAVLAPAAAHREGGTIFTGQSPRLCPPIAFDVALVLSWTLAARHRQRISRLTAATQPLGPPLTVPSPLKRRSILSHKGEREKSAPLHQIPSPLAGEGFPPRSCARSLRKSHAGKVRGDCIGWRLWLHSDYKGDTWLLKSLSRWTRSSASISGGFSPAPQLEAQWRGHDVFYYTPANLPLRDGQVDRPGPQPALVRGQAGYSLSPTCPSRSVDLAQYDVVYLRQDPPFDMAYPTTTHLLRAHPPRNRSWLNDPASVRTVPTPASCSISST